MENCENTFSQTDEIELGLKNMLDNLIASDSCDEMIPDLNTTSNDEENQKMSLIDFLTMIDKLSKEDLLFGKAVDKILGCKNGEANNVSVIAEVLSITEDIIDSLIPNDDKSIKLATEKLIF